MEVDSVGIIAIFSMLYITTRIVKTDKCGKNCHKILSACAEYNICLARHERLRYLGYTGASCHMGQVLTMV